MKSDHIPSQSGIYKIVNLQTQLVYIGSAINLRKRCVNHCWDLNRGRHPNYKLLRDWKRYGAESFEFVVIILCSKAELLQQEQVWLAITLAAEVGYNILTIAGSVLGRHHTFESKQAIGEKARQRWADPIFKVVNNDLLQSISAKDRQRRLLQAKWADPEFRKHVVASNLGNTNFAGNRRSE